MAKRIATAILMCAVMALVAFVPLVAGGDHTITKGPQGPRASAMTWIYEPTEYGIWTAQLDNHGLRSLVIDVYDNTSGMPMSILHQRIRFAAYNAYPSGIVLSESVGMARGTYEITATPNGPRDSYVVVSDQWTLPPPPEASFIFSMSGHAVNVDASASTGAITEFVWEWGDGTMGIGMTASHTYMAPGTYTIMLKVTDVGGLQDIAMQDVVFPDVPPKAAFTITVDGLTVYVNASASTDDWGIESYSWNWGDQTTGSGVTASHTYVVAAAAASASAQTSGVIINAEPPPYYVAGHTYDAMGVALTNCLVKVTNLRTGEWGETTSSATTGLYRFNLWSLASDFLPGDLINVTATNGTLIGWNEMAVPDPLGSYMTVDVTLIDTAVVEPFEVTITLTVTDAKGQTATLTQTVMIYP